MNSGQVTYTILKSPIGDLLVGSSEKGCCICEFDDRGGTDRILARAERHRKTIFSKGSTSYIEEMESQLRDYFDGRRLAFTLPLDFHGTAFQMSVWRQLLEIPYGETRSYGEIASSLRMPGAARAVGSANGANLLAIIVPCHRVIQEDGSLRGYGGGLWRKRFLLELEREHCSPQSGVTHRQQHLAFADE